MKRVTGLFLALMLVFSASVFALPISFGACAGANGAATSLPC